MPALSRCLLVLVSAALAAVSHQPAAAIRSGHASLTLSDAYPETRRQATTEMIHGSTVPDPYRWLEAIETSEVRTWTIAQDAVTAAVLDHRPLFTQVKDRIERDLGFSRTLSVWRAGGRLFSVVGASGTATSRELHMQPSLTAPATSLVGAEADAEGWSFSGVFSPSPDGRLVAYGLTLPGSRWTRVRVLDVDSGKPLSDRLSGLNASFGAMAWASDGSGLYYNGAEEPPTSEMMRAVVASASSRFHRLGTAQSEDASLFEGRDGDLQPVGTPVPTTDGRYLLLPVAKREDGGNGLFLWRLKERDKKPRVLVTSGDATVRFLGSSGDTFWLQTNEAAPRGRVVSQDVRRPWAPRTIVAESGDSMIFASLVAARLLVVYSKDAVPTIKSFDLEGRFERTIDLPRLGVVWGPPWGPGFTGRESDEDTFFSLSSVADPGTVFRLEPQSARLEVFAKPSLKFDPDTYTISPLQFTARDGTRIPIFIAHRRDVSPRGRAVLMYAYGAFGWSAFPWYQPAIVAWMDAGGVYALPCVRGGGEYGEAWHEAALRTKKQQAIDDYLDAANYLVSNGYTSSDRLVANGGSASAPVVAAAVLQHPDRFAAALIDIPLLDMVRYEQATAGPTWVAEFGSVKQEAAFRALLAYSPYHNLRPGAAYPPILVTAGEKDETAVPWHAYKFLAALQNVATGENRALMQVVWGAGHNYGTSPGQSALSWARQLEFLRLHLPVGAYGRSANPERIEP